MLNLPRIKRLITGRYTWIPCDGTSGEEHVDHYGWSDRWAIDGIHSCNWRWVKRYGAKPCGCTINPITRRQVLYSWRCTEHWNL